MTQQAIQTFETLNRAALGKINGGGVSVAATVCYPYSCTHPNQCDSSVEVTCVCQGVCMDPRAAGKFI